MSGLASVHVLAELERMGWAYTFAGEAEVKCKCPFHDDQSPSCNLNTEKRLFHCCVAGCNAKGDFITFMAKALQTTRAVVIKDLSTRYDFEEAKIIEMETVERYHAAIWAAQPLLKALKDRGVSDALIRKYRLGEDDGRITIPIKNDSGNVVNIRKYLPGAPGKDKMRNSRGHGGVRLYPIEQLKYPSIVICGGEMKAIVAAAELNKHHIGAITATSGEGNWDVSLTPSFKDKKVWVMLDVDPEGQTAATTLCNLVHRVADWTGNVVIPLDKDKYPHGDVNDWVGQEKKKIKPLLDDCPKWEPTTRLGMTNEEPEEAELRAATTADFAGKRVRLKAIVSAIDTAPYIIPKELTVVCDKSQRECAMCPVYLNDATSHEIHPESPAILEMVSAPKVVQREAIMRGLGVPLSCKVVEFDATSYYNVEDTRISPQLEITNRASDRVMQPAVCIGGGVELNETYQLTGRMHPHPKTQQSTLLISKYHTAKDALSTYECVDLDRLNIFQPKEWTVDAIHESLTAIYDDMEANVTRIFQRRDLHLAVDLTYHSPLFLNFDGRVVKGWTEVLVLGDSAQGKSETALNLMRHYGLGEKVECKNASVAGLLGGLQQMGSRWFVTWGVIPTHDKRLVILEELKGASTDVIAKLTDMRSSGIAEIPKIEKRRTHARVRLLALSNPRSDLQLSSYNFGIEAIKELVGGLEDVRRFDLALLVSSSDIDTSELNKLQRTRPTVAHTFSSELCRRLILWGWTRTSEQVSFDQDATVATLDAATQLSDEFTDAIPLIDRGSARYKIARLAAALACRTFSHGDDPTCIRVRAAHVEYIVEYIRRLYNSHTFGYADFTAAMQITAKLIDPEQVTKHISETPFPGDFIKQVLHTNSIEIQDIQDWCAWDRHEAMQLLSFFVRKHALRRDGRSYRKTPHFIRLLKDMLAKGNFADRPDFIPEQEF